MMRHLVPVVVAGAALLAAAPAAAESEAADTRELSHGYAMFHLAASRLSHIDKALWLKAEPETVTDLLEALATTMGELVASLEGYQDTPPAIRLDDTGLPRLEVEKRQSVYLAMGEPVKIEEEDAPAEIGIAAMGSSSSAATYAAIEPPML